MQDVKNQVVVVTGAASGIGAEVAVALAERGAVVVVVARAGRVDAAVANVKGRVDGAVVEGVACDVSSKASIAQACAEIVRRHPAVKLLVNNAAVFHAQRKTSVDGLELGFAVNTLAPFLMTRGLERALVAGKGRVVHMTMKQATAMSFTDPQTSTTKYVALDVLKRTKAGSIYLTRAMQQRFGGAVDVVCVDPGITQSKLPSEAPLPVRLLFKLLGKTPAEGARVPLAACLDDVAYPSGAFVSEKGKAGPLPAFVDDASAERAWQLCENLGAQVA